MNTRREATMPPEPSAMPVPPQRKSFDGFLPIPWENYVLCVLFHLVLPLVPVGFEILLTRQVRPSSLLLTVSCYLIAMGVSSASRLYFGVTLVFGLLFATMYGHQVAFEVARVTTAGVAGTSRFATLIVTVSTALVFGLLHGSERYRRHVLEEKPYWIFIPEKEETR